MSNYPTVRLDALVKDQCNFVDQAFEKYVDDWMNRMMPGFPIGLLDTDNIERWEIAGRDYFSVEEYELRKAQCDNDEDCAEEWDEEWGQEIPDGPLCPTCEKGKVIVETETVYVVRDDDYIDQHVEHPLTSSDGDTKEGWSFWRDEDEAEAEAEQQSLEAGHERSYGFPWANGWCYLPDNYVQTEDLQAAGFVVATYTGGNGEGSSNEQYRLCGIDGGGYSFAGQHFAKLVALHHERNTSTVKTDAGYVHITTDYRTLSEQLAADSTEQIQG